MLWSGRWQDKMKRAKNRSSSGKFVLRISSPIAPCPFPYYADYRETLEQQQQPAVFSNAEKIDCFQAIIPTYGSETKEIYIPCHEWDAQNPAERYASVTDLCAHIGDQLPIQVVKLIARDILRSLDNLHCTRGAVHGSKNAYLHSSPKVKKAKLKNLCIRYHPTHYTAQSDRPPVSDIPATCGNPTFLPALGIDSRIAIRKRPIRNAGYNICCVHAFRCQRLVII